MSKKFQIQKSIINAFYITITFDQFNAPLLKEST